jgi:hypothetical protein
MLLAGMGKSLVRLRVSLEGLRVSLAKLQVSLAGLRVLLSEPSSRELGIAGKGLGRSGRGVRSPLAGEKDSRRGLGAGDGPAELLEAKNGLRVVRDVGEGVSIVQWGAGTCGLGAPKTADGPGD